MLNSLTQIYTQISPATRNYICPFPKMWNIAVLIFVLDNRLIVSFVPCLRMPPDLMQHCTRFCPTFWCCDKGFNFSISNKIHSFTRMSNSEQIVCEIHCEGITNVFSLQDDAPQKKDPAVKVVMGKWNVTSWRLFAYPNNLVFAIQMFQQ